ncbi:dynein light chain roadblock-type 2 [Drosophila pseudoobscura]|uniref:Dynein light chain roadblock-type 2 n=1 Tax=Drosophila pseudoobscura pseudoobscura TaxID=46245 RepID=A0A6I8W2J7_DROPS|nr:dynein light chain roadblock-type 2 [Drosophila pseudoobscura]
MPQISPHTNFTETNKIFQWLKDLVFLFKRSTNSEKHLAPTSLTTIAMSDVETTFDRLLKLPGVMGAILVNGEGEAVRTSMDSTSSSIFAGKMRPMVKMARALVHEVEPTDELTYLRMRTLKSEILVAAENEHMIILVQDTNILDEARRNSSSSSKKSE